MSINVGDLVMIEGSDSQWEVTRVDKFSVDVIDTGMGIVELEEIPLHEIVDVLYESDDDSEEDE